jgi:ATP-dependent Zn protease
MDEEFGLIALSPEDASRGPLAAKINERISGIIKEEMSETVNIISKAKAPINKLVKELLEKNRLTGEEINSILEKSG